MIQFVLMINVFIQRQVILTSSTIFATKSMPHVLLAISSLSRILGRIQMTLYKSDLTQQQSIAHCFENGDHVIN